MKIHDQQKKGSTHAAAPVPHPSSATVERRAARLGGIQAKLTISEQGDAAEREADRVAEAVLAPKRDAAIPLPELSHRLSQQGAGGNEAPPIVHEVVRSFGEPLDRESRSFFEPRFGYDLSRVRTHTDGKAAASAAAVSAHAYTVGHDVVFGAGKYTPSTREGRSLLAHELTHVIQQTGGNAVATPVQAKAVEPGMEDEVKTRRDDTAHGAVSRAPLTNGLLQRDFALEPPRPRAEGRVLTTAEMQAAIAFNQRVVAVIGTAGISELRDVLGVDPNPPDIDEDFVRGVVDWQAVQAVQQDGKLGPLTARRLFREIGAENVGRGGLVSGPTYRATTGLTPPVVGGNQQAGFTFETEFAEDPANGLYASCCEVRQFIQWDGPSAAALPGGIPHGGFAAGTAANTWVEDRDTADTRYGHRTGPHSALGAGDEYVDNTGARNAAFGHIYRGRDFPGGPDPLLAGHWRFNVRAIDVANGNRVLGQDFLRITWV